MVKTWVLHKSVCVNLVRRGGYPTSLGSATLPAKVSRDMGYRSDSIATSRDMGPPSQYNINMFGAFHHLPTVDELPLLCLNNISPRMYDNRLKLVLAPVDQSHGMIYEH